MSTIFKKIIDKEIPATIVYEDDKIIAFDDINPAAPVHVQVIPKEEILSIHHCKSEHQELLGHLLLKCQEIAVIKGVDKTGYRLVTNTDKDGGQEVRHLHFHLIGGRALKWPPG